MFERYQTRVFGVIWGILGNREDADEIAQEVFAKVYFSIHAFNGRSSLYTWIYRIAVNECYGLLRKRKPKVGYTHDASDVNVSRAVENRADPCPVSRSRSHRTRLGE